MTKVLHLITHLDAGGAQDNTLITVENLPRSRYEVHLAAGIDYVDWQPRAVCGADRFISLPHLKHPIAPGHDVRAYVHLVKLLKKERYQILHTHSSKAGIIGRLAGRLTGVPYIVHTIHGFPWHDYMPALQKQVYVRLERFVSRLTDRLITVSDLNKEEAIRYGLAPRDRIQTIYSGIDLAKFQVAGNAAEKKRQLNIPAGSPVIGMIGRLSRQKAPLDFVTAAKIILKRRPEVVFLLIGDGPDRDQVAAASAGFPQIRMLGQRDDIPELLALLDIFALSSLWEGLGRAMTEAMMMKVPVAVTRVNGVPELVAHGETGLLSDPADPVGLAENLLWLLDHPEERFAMARRGYRRVIPAFDADHMVGQIDALYQTLLANPGRRPLK